MIYLLAMVIFHSYVRLLEGNNNNSPTSKVRLGIVDPQSQPSLSQWCRSDVVVSIYPEEMWVSWCIKTFPYILHVWYIHLHDLVIFRVNVGKYSSTMEHLGFAFWFRLWFPEDNSQQCDVVNTMPFAPFPSHQHFYGWYVYHPQSW